MSMHDAYVVEVIEIRHSFVDDIVKELNWIKIHLI